MSNMDGSLWASVYHKPNIKNCMELTEHTSQTSWRIINLKNSIRKIEFDGVDVISANPDKCDWDIYKPSIKAVTLEIPESSLEYQLPYKDDLGKYIESSKSMSYQELECKILKQVDMFVVDEIPYEYDKTHYKPISKNRFVSIVRERLSIQDNCAIKRLNTYNDCLKYISANPRLQIDPFDPIWREFETYIAFENCVVDAKTLKVYKHSPEFLLTTMIKAQYYNEDTPYFDKFLYEFSDGDEIIMEVILQMIGYILISSQRAKKYFFIGLNKNSGKSLLAEFITKLFPVENISTTTLHELGEKFKLDNMWQTALLTSKETENKPIKTRSINVLKSLTGDERINTERKCCDNKHSTVCRAKLLYCSNYKLQLQVDEESVWERMILIPAGRTIQENEVDRMLNDKIWDERNGIVYKAVQACHRLIMNSYVFPKIPKAEQMIEEWRNIGSDGIKGFFESCCVISAGNFVPTYKLYEAYLVYCNKHFITPKTQDYFSAHFNDMPNVLKYRRRENKEGNPLKGFLNIELIKEIDVYE